MGLPRFSSIGFLEQLAEFFDLTDAQKQQLFDAAAIGRRQLPADLADDELFLKALPAFFRAARGHELDGDTLAAFAEDIRKLHRADPQH